MLFGIETVKQIKVNIVNRIFKRTEGISTTDLVGKLISLSTENKRKSFITLNEKIKSNLIRASEFEENFNVDDFNEEFSNPIDKIQLLNTSRRIKYFSNHR